MPRSGFAYFSMLLALILVLTMVVTSTHAQLQARFNADKVQGCAPLVVNFSNTTTGAGENAQFKWDLGNGNISTLRNPSVIFTEEKTYTVRLTVTDGDKVSSQTIDIKIHPKPTIDFSASIVKGCVPIKVDFTSTVNPGTGTSFFSTWDFGDGSTQEGTGSLMQHTFDRAQDVSVSLTVKNLYGCYAVLSKPNLIKLLPELKPDFTPDKAIICAAGDPVVFTNQSTGPGSLTYSWEYGNGDVATDKNPSYTYPAKGNYNVTLNVTSSEGCKASIQKPINAYNIANEILVPGLVCSDAQVNLVASTNPAPSSYSWNVDGTPLPSSSALLPWQFNYTGNHVVKMIANYGNCSVVTTKNFEVKQSPTVNDFDLQIPNTCAVPAKVDVKDLTNDHVKWDWSFEYFGQTNPTVHATTKNASYTYNSLQHFTVRMRAYNADGCYRDVSKTVPLQGADIRVESKTYYPYQDIVSCGPLTTGFRAVTLETITKYNWRLDGEASTSTVAEPIINVSTPGTHTLVLEYETARGCKATATYNYRIIVKKKPVIDIVPSSTKLCGTNSVQFTAVGELADVVYYQWYTDNQGNFSSTNNSATFSYQKKGIYDVRLIADLNGCRDTIDKKQLVEVVPPFPQIQGIKNDCVERDKIEFFTPTDEGDKWVWDFGDGKTETYTSYQPNIKHQFPGTGYYHVKLTVSHGACTLSTIAPATVLMSPVAVLSAPSNIACFDEGLQYKVEVPYNPGALTMPPWPPNWTGYTWHYSMTRWEYEDGTDFMGNDGSYYHAIVNFPTIGKLTKLDPTKSKIRLILREASTGCLDTSNYLSFKLKGAHADFQLLNNDICYSTPMQAKDLSTNNPGSPITSVEWDFGDGQKLIAQKGETISHSYRQPGSYAVSIKITDDGGCVSDLKQSAKFVRINGPVASISASHDNIPRNEFVSFYNSTNDYGYYRSTWNWDFGDGQSSTERSPKHAYSNVGKYTVTLRATDPVTGCSSSSNVDVIVENTAAAFTVSKSFVGSANCLPLLAKFNVTTYNVTNFSWDFGDGTTAGNTRYPNHIYTRPGKYIITLTTRGSDGTTAVYKDSIIINQPLVKVEANKLDACKGETINWTLTGEHNRGYFWDYGDGTVQDLQNGTSNHAYPRAGLYKPSIMIRDSGGCLLSSEIDKVLTIRPDPVLKVDPNPAAACLGQSIQLNVSGADTYSWTPSAGLNNPQIANPVARINTTTTFKINGVDDIGCVGSKDMTVLVHQPFGVKLASAATICAGEILQLNASGGDRYQWIENITGMNNASVASPRVLPSTNAIYKVVGYDHAGCFTDTATIAVTVNPRPVVNAGIDQEVEAGQQVQLSGTADSEITRWIWSPSMYLSCTSCPAPVSIPQSEITYKLTAANKFGCESADEVTIKLLCDEARIRIPNAFSPNNDGHNDRFVIKGISLVKHITIYNRWGNKVFERENFFAGDASSCWDGTNNGIAQATGTYVYVIEMECPNKTGKFMKKGTVTLIR